ncbi:MAG: hypothetical protein LQ343_004379 [Gyalolechia ehrenbergii]|nr:MAG: hypothetical protein LQ343_004379 [Gyalolechia ehrenbergii]
MPSVNFPIGSPPVSSKTISISLGASQRKPSNPTKTTPSSSLNPRKRPHSSLNDSDSDSDAEASAQRAPQLVAAFDHSAGGAISVNGVEKAKEPLVIQVLKNRDWREESRRKEKRAKNLLPAEVQAQRNGVHAPAKGHGEVERNEVSQLSGLQFVSQPPEDEANDGYGEVEMTMNGKEESGKPKSADEEALEALLGDGSKKSILVVPAVQQTEKEDEEDFRNGMAGMNEDDHFRSDVASRPDSASLDDYARVPVEEFGLGMLRGMGWKEGEVVGKRKDQVSKARVVERRPALLGIGAKEVPGGVGEELGAWGKVTKGKHNKKVDKTYNPVLLKNSKTGEMLTEEEFFAKKERQMVEEREWKERRDRNLTIDEEKKSERKRREREKEYADGSSRSRRRGRSRSSDSKRHSSRRERSRSSDRRRGSSRRERSSSGERRRHSNDDRKEKERRRRERYERDDATSSRHSHRSRDEYDDTRRRRHEVY